MKTNKLIMRKLLFNGICGGLLVAMVACGGADTTEVETAEEATALEEDAGVMDNWDTERFSTSFNETDRFGGWDENDDAFLDENEFYGSYFETWDVNDDELLEEEEWTTASADFGLEGENWADWDTNKDNKLDEVEFRAGVEKNNYFRDWDKDKNNTLNEREYSEGVFGLWDDDDDNSITNEEYDTRYNRYYGEPAVN